MPLRHTALAMLVMIVWGVNFVVIEVGLEAFPPLFFVALRFLVAALPAVFLVGRPCVAWRWVVTIGLAIGVGQFGLLFVGMHLGMPAGLASLVMQLQAVFTLLLAAWMLRERVRPLQVLGLAIAFAGIVLVGIDFGASAPLLAFALCVIGSGCWAFGNVTIRRAAPSDLLNLTVWTSIVPPGPLLVLSLTLEGPTAGLDSLQSMGWTGVGALAFLGYLATLGGWAAWGWLIRKHGAGRVAPYSLLVPIFGMSSAALLLDEHFGPLRLIAAVLVVGGVALATVRGRERVPTPVPATPPVVRR